MIPYSETYKELLVFCWGMKDLWEETDLKGNMITEDDRGNDMTNDELHKEEIKKIPRKLDSNCL